ncbi:hypothetical protein STEG23_013056, partial [Scotinomys teguina]
KVAYMNSQYPLIQPFIIAAFILIFPVHLFLVLNWKADFVSMIFNSIMKVFDQYVCLCTICLHFIHGGQKKASEQLGLELPIAELQCHLIYRKSTFRAGKKNLDGGRYYSFFTFSFFSSTMTSIMIMDYTSENSKAMKSDTYKLFNMLKISYCEGEALRLGERYEQGAEECETRQYGAIFWG